MPQDQDPQVSLDDFEEQRRQYYGIPKGLAESLRTQESGGRQYDKTGKVLTSPKQAKGRYQVLQDTADRYGLNASDPFENIEAGFRYLSDLNKQVDKNVTDPGERWAQTLAGYHAGDKRLRETNKTGNLPATSDGLIRTDKYVRNIMERWQRHDQGRSGQPAQPAQQPTQTEEIRFDLNDPKIPAPRQPQKPRVSGSPGSADDPLTKPDPLGYDNQGRPRSRVLMESVHAFETLKRMGSKEPAAEIAEEIGREFGKEMEVGTGTGGWAYVKPKRGSGINYDVNKMLSSPIPSPEEWARQIRAEADEKALQEDRRRRRAEFERKPLIDQIGARAYDAFAAGGGDVSKMLRQGVQATKAFTKKTGVPIFAGSLLVPDSALEAWRQGEEERMRGIQESQAGRPSSFASDVGEGIVRAIPTAAAALGGGMLTGGGVGAGMAIGGGMGAASADWKDTEQALTQTAFNAVFPVAGGKLGGRVGAEVARRLSRPAAQAAARAGGELVGGAAGNVMGSGVEQLAFDGGLDSRELIKQAITGAALNIPSAANVARSGAPAIPRGTRPGVAPELSPQDLTDLNIRRAIDSYTQEVDAINRSQAPPATKAAQLAQARTRFQAERAAVAGESPVAAREPGIQFQPWPRNQQGAIIAPESPIANQRLLNPAPSAPETQPIPLPDAPITQESPALRQWMDAENALTSEIPVAPMARQTGEIPRTTPRLLPAEPTVEGPLRRTAEIRRPQEGLEARPGQSLNLKRAGSEPEPTNRIAGGAGAELPRYAPRPLEGQPIEQPGPLRRPTERLRVPMATEENVAQLRNRREDLDRLRFDREGELTRDLADERRELGAEIARFENDQAKAQRGNRFDQDAPPEYVAPERQAGRQGDRVTPEEAAARRAALVPGPRASGLLQSSTPGRPVTQEVQIPSARNPRTDFNSREDARQARFDQMTDDELVAEIGRMQDVKNQAIGGKSKLTPAQLEANDFDLKIATRMQVERGKIQRAQGVDAANRIAPRSAAKAPKARQIQHSTYGLVTEAANQKGVPAGKLRVTGEDGAEHTIQNPRTRGNREATFVKSAPAPRSTGPIPSGALPELRDPNAPPSPLKGKQSPLKARPNYAIPDEAMPELRNQPRRRSGGTYMGAGLGGLQPLFEGGGKQSQSKTPKLFDDQPSDGLTTRERIGRKVGTAQTIAQLLNPKTISQNIIGNAAFAGGKNLASVVALPVDKILSAFTKQRQVSTPKLKAQISDFKKGFTEAYHAVRDGDYAKLSENNRYELNDQRAFKGKVGGFFEDVMSIALRAPDRGAYLAAYNDSVQQIIAANKKSKRPYSLDQIHEQAQIEAQQATFQDKNLISDLATKLRDALNTVTPFGKKSNFGLGDLVGLKYVKTPANLVARGVEYSPLGFINAFAKTAKVLAGKGKTFDQRDASLAFGKAFVGSAFGSGLGAALYSMGIIAQPEQENRSVQAAERAEGLSGYQVNLSALKRYATGGLLDALTGDLGAGKKQAGDVMMSYDWLQPWAFSLGMGAAAAKAFEKRKADADLLEDTLTQIDAITSTLTDQSVLRNIRDIFKKGAAETGRRILTDTPSSFVPSVLNLARQILDDHARETSKGKGAEGIKQEALEKVLNRLPGASKSLPEKTDPVGRPVPSRMSGAGGAAMTLVPGRFTEYNPHPVLSEMAATGAGTSSLQPRDGETEGQFKARRDRAAEWRNQYGLKLTSSQAYQSASQEQKKAALDRLEEQISAQSGERRPRLYLFAPGRILQAVRENERKNRREARRGGAASQ